MVNITADTSPWSPAGNNLALTLEYQRPPFLFSAHLETIYPALLRRIPALPYQRERISTDDDDFLDVDWLRQGSQKVVILSHGLEGNSSRAYMKGMARACYTHQFDVLTWNFRGCSEEMNRRLRFYHSGATDDLDRIVRLAAEKGYREIYLIGFSLGGNLTLKYLGERTPHAAIRKAVAISVPVDLYQSAHKLSQPSNWIYANRFLKSLKNKVMEKSRSMPSLDVAGIGKIQSLMQFDDRFTAPLHGFENAMDYYTRCSALRFLDSIKTPTLLVNALNDPFLSESCYPGRQVQDHAFVTFESPRFGGHVGFAQFGKNRLYWSEERALKFLAP